MNQAMNCNMDQIDMDDIYWLLMAFKKFYPEKAPFPFPKLCPTPGGDIMAEWRSESYEMSLDIDLAKKTGYLHLHDRGNATSSEDIDLALDMSKEDGWIELSDRAIIFLEEDGEAEQ